ncbi:SGNH/GDSL hydrolase family protein [Cohnella zeiphila]|uniref:GDSL family lipase n=1 Tax=Cohnella zeiphila TaxID=2761120 RepID=A0A7X0W1E4_9BACL|nr:SGNH/GDSL hydrolase family protein [Cohnella zeiphila]MBB6735983.1 GDSL family lipase [Cohnella zeiphila]
MKRSDRLKTLALSEVPHLKVHGRTTDSLSPLTLFWTGSALEFNARGSELWVEVEADYDAYEPWVSIVIDSVPVSRQMVTAGTHWLCVFRGMNGNVVKNVRIVKDTQAMSGDPNGFLQFRAVRFDGQFLPVEDNSRKIEFIGDSITSGEGAIGARSEEDWIPMWFSAIRNYAAMTAEALDADYRIVSQSGWGVLTGWDNNPRCNLPQYYEQVCGLLSGEKNEAMGVHRRNDFASWPPDAVVVNLGTNDGSAFRTPEWRDPVTGETRKQRMNEDGTYHQEDLNVLEQAIQSFLHKLRACNPRAHLVWAYGMLGDPMMPAIRRAVESYAEQSGDRNVSVYPLPPMTEETTGARSHPGAKAHELAAERLAGHLEPILSQMQALR